MITYKLKSVESIPYLTAYITNKESPKEISKLSIPELKSYFEKNILYTRGFLEVMTNFEKRFTKKEQYLLAKKVSDNYPISWDDLIKQSYESIPGVSSNCFDIEKKVKNESYNPLPEELWLQPSSDNSGIKSLDQILSEGMY